MAAGFGACSCYGISVPRLEKKDGVGGWEAAKKAAVTVVDFDV
jgi:hypothetical protein